MTLNPQDAPTAHEREQTCKVIDRLGKRAEDFEYLAKGNREQIEYLNSQIAELQNRRSLVRRYLEQYDEGLGNARFAVEMLEAELEGDTDSTWRKDHPEAANAEAQARAEVEKQEAQARGRVKIMEVR